jgi:hypothetical protein
MSDEKRNERPESYPKPTERDSMLKYQGEFDENVNTQSSSHFPDAPHADSETPQVKRMPNEDPGTDRTRDLP